MTIHPIVIVQELLSDGVLLRPSGEVDMARSPALRAKLQEAFRARPQPRRVVVDLTLVPYMDSSGVATLVEALQSASRAGTELVLCGLSPRVKSIFQISRLYSIFTISETPGG
ncbi:MAG: anti-sigma factor antagonist [Phycisphaerales bacterium]|nr:anti-sigma factor antagonist [Phycisphaerales bacterium]